MTFPLKIKVFLIVSFLIFLGFGVNKVGAVSIELSPEPDSEGFINGNTVRISVSYDCIEAKVTIDGQNCQWGGLHKYNCGRDDGEYEIKVTCVGGASASRRVKLDGQDPFVGPISITGKEGVGSVATEEKSNVKKLAGIVIVEVLANDAGSGTKKAELFLAPGDINPTTRKPTTCGNYGKLNPVSPANPINGSGPKYAWEWNTENVSDERYYCLKATVYDKNGNSNSSETFIIVNNRCDKDNDGFVSPEKFDLGCKDVVCFLGCPTDWFCCNTKDCNDDRDKGGYYARPYDNISSRDYYESRFSPRSFYSPNCSFRSSCSACNPEIAKKWICVDNKPCNCPTLCNGCPACDDNLDNDCDEAIDMNDTQCSTSCDRDGDHFYNVECLKPEDWAEKGDCNDNDVEINFEFKESFKNSACVKIACCNDSRDNDCNGNIDQQDEECNWAKYCDKDDDKYIAKECSPDDKKKTLPQGFLGWDDCDDNDLNVYPGKQEIQYGQGCDGKKDNNCDGKDDSKDSNCIAICDKDGDGYFNYYDKNLEGHKDESLKVCGGKFDQEPTPQKTFLVERVGLGNIGPGTYSYKITFVTPRGETQGSESVSITITENSELKLDNIPTGAPGVVVARKIYRTKAGSQDFRLLATLNNNTYTYYVDNSPDPSLREQTIPIGNTTGNSQIIAGGRGHDSDDNNPNVNSGASEKGSLCHDGIDNDSDGLIDGADPGCQAPEGKPFLGGLVPCGRNYDDPDTPEANEADPCTICHFFYVLERVITFLRNLAFIVAPLLIVICGIMFSGASVNSSIWQEAR